MNLSDSCKVVHRHGGTSVALLLNRFAKCVPLFENFDVVTSLRNISASYKENVSASVHVACNLDASAVHIKLTHSRCMSTVPVPPCKKAKLCYCSSAQICMHSNFEDGSTCIAFTRSTDALYTQFTCLHIQFAPCSSLIINTVYGLISRASWVLLVF